MRRLNTSSAAYPNGAGKTILMCILAGLLEPISGQVTLDGQDVLGSSGICPKISASTPT
jgi:ABC-type multidrug transport system ATPase subunit